MRASWQAKKIRPDVGSPLAASPTRKQRLDFGKPNVMWPSVGAHLDRVAVFIVGAVDQDAVDAGFPHLSEGEFLLAGGFGQCPMIPWIGHRGKPLELGLFSA
jgi:hypothetical protein